MGVYVKKSMSSDWTRFRDLKARACFVITRTTW
jgi:hypothetical protein